MKTILRKRVAIGKRQMAAWAPDGPRMVSANCNPPQRAGLQTGDDGSPYLIADGLGTGRSRVENSSGSAAAAYNKAFEYRA